MAKLVIAVTGGVAAFKSAALVSMLVKESHQVQVAVSHAAERFVGKATFASLSANPVISEMFDQRFPLGPHIELARWADLLVVAPATVNFFAKAATGIADDLISTLYMAFPGTTLAAPAMNHEMFHHKAFQRNLEIVQEDGMKIIGPSSGWQACRTNGDGRMVEASGIMKEIKKLVSE